ncbi:MAG: DUF4173 domain-containing protein [Chloroflexota bacterium]
MTAKKATSKGKKQGKKKTAVNEPMHQPEWLPESLLETQDETAASDLPPSFHDPFIRKPGVLAIVALALGLLFDFLFWDQVVGVNFAIFITIVIFGGILWLTWEGKRPRASSLWLLLPFLFFDVFSFIRNEPLTRSLSFVGILFSTGVLASTYIGGRWMEYGLSDYLSKYFLLIANVLSGGISLAADTRKYQLESDSAKPQIPVWALLRGLLIALPIVACFASLLAAGDVVFNQKLQDFFDFEDLGEFIWRSFTVLFWAYIIVGVFRHAALHSRDNELIREGKSAVKPFLGFTETAVILACVSGLFLIFVVIQFQYFFGGQTNIGVEGYTYSQYARRGFNELVTVAFLSLVLILGLSSVTRRETDQQKRTYSWLSAFLVALVLVILISAYQRISLAIDWHGYSRLRLYPRIFLIWLALLLVAVIVLEIIRKERYFAFAAVVASVGFAVTLTLFNVDAAIVKYNIPRVLNGKWINVGHLASLSTDAVPVLVDEFLSKKYALSDHEKIGAALTCYLHFMPEEVDEDWQSFNLSQRRAEDALQRIEPALQEYGINDEKWPVRARTPGGSLYDCRYYGYEE